jgi:hypothetical protein
MLGCSQHLDRFGGKRDWKDVCESLAAGLQEMSSTDTAQHSQKRSEECQQERCDLAPGATEFGSRRATVSQAGNAAVAPDVCVIDSILCLRLLAGHVYHLCLLDTPAHCPSRQTCS